MNRRLTQAGFVVNEQNLPFLRSKQKGGIGWHFLRVQ